jgi:hypothetical protein
MSPEPLVPSTILLWPRLDGFTMLKFVTRWKPAENLVFSKTWGGYAWHVPRLTPPPPDPPRLGWDSAASLLLTILHIRRHNFENIHPHPLTQGDPPSMVP